MKVFFFRRMKLFFTILFCAVLCGNANAQKTDSTLILGCIPKQDMLDNQKVYRLVEKNIEFNGGEEKMYRYISEHIRIPDAAMTKDVIVYVTFVVDTSGTLRNPCILQNQSAAEIAPFKAEALRMVSEMPKWIPAESKGVKVYSRKHLPVKFEKK